MNCDKKCYGERLDLPKGHPDRKEMSPLAEKCPNNPKIYEEFLATVFVFLMPIIIIILLIILFFKNI